MHDVFDALPTVNTVMYTLCICMICMQATDNITVPLRTLYICWVIYTWLGGHRK